MGHLLVPSSNPNGVDALRYCRARFG
jgi:hypothetical protein